DVPVNAYYNQHQANNGDAGSHGTPPLGSATSAPPKCGLAHTNSFPPASNIPAKLRCDSGWATELTTDGSQYHWDCLGSIVVTKCWANISGMRMQTPTPAPPGPGNMPHKMLDAHDEQLQTESQQGPQLWVNSPEMFRKASTAVLQTQA